MNSTKMNLDSEFEIKSIQDTHKIAKFKYKRRGFKRYLNKKVIVLTMAPIMFVVFLLLSFFVFKFDSYLFPSKLNGVVSATGDGAIGDVKVCLKSKCSRTDANGNTNWKI